MITNDKTAQHLIRYIVGAQKSIFIAIYMLTNRDIVKALIDAKNERGIDIQIVTDQTCLERNDSRNQLLDLLKQNNIEVFIYPSTHMHNGKRVTRGIMHHKFAIIDTKVWTGSFNWTYYANNRNQENVIVLDDSSVLSKFMQKFTDLKMMCSRHYAPKR